MNKVILIGRLVRDPELQFIAGSGTAVARFTLAVDRDYSKEKKMQMEGQGKPTADFPRVTVWGKTAENCANYLAKGSRVAVDGTLQTGSYEKSDGTRVYTTDVNAYRVEFLETRQESNGYEGSRPAPRGDGMPTGHAFDPNDDDIPF